MKPDLSAEFTLTPIDSFLLSYQTEFTEIRD